ncbi:MAG: pentapeptide repeat-containing protein [Propioniciclava sp.]
MAEWSRESIVATLQRHRPASNQGRLDLQGVDWRGLDLRGLNLNNLDLAEANLASADLSQATAVGTDFARALLPIRIVGADLAEADLYKSEGAAVDFTGSRLSGARLLRGNFFNAIFRRADLSAAILTDGIFDGCDFSEARLDRAEVSIGPSDCTVDGATAGDASGAVHPSATVTVDGQPVSALEWFQAQSSRIEPSSGALPEASSALLQQWLDAYLRKRHP